MVLGSRPFFDLSVEEGSREWEAAVSALYDEVLKLQGFEVYASEAHPAAGSGLVGLPGAGGGATAVAAGGAGGGLAATPADGQLTMVQKVEKIRNQLGLEQKLGIGAAIAEANASLGIEPAGALHVQVERLLAELGMA